MNDAAVKIDWVSNASSAILEGNYYWFKNGSSAIYWKKLLEIHVSPTTGRRKFVFHRLRMLVNWVSIL